MRQLAFIIIALLLWECAGPYRHKLPLPAENLKVVVFPFTTRGPGLSQRSEYIAADMLTVMLYTSKHIPVVDRSIVNDELSRRQVGNPYFLSRQTLKAVADTLQASVVVLGAVENNIIRQRLNATRHTVTVTLRFLDGQTGDILYIDEYSESAGQPPETLLDQCLRVLVDRL